MDHIERLDKFRTNRVALHVKLSKLSAANKRPHFLRLAIDLFENKIRTIEGHMFILQNHDIVVIAQNVPLIAFDTAVERLHTLFAEDPLFQDKNASGEDLCTWYRLESDYGALRDAARKLLQDAELARSITQSKKALMPIQPDLLGRLEQALTKTDLSGIARRQMTCTLIPGQQPKPLFEEIYISIADLQERVTPGVDLFANRWLFQYLTHTLDRRMLAMLTRDGVRKDQPFSLNLNVATVLSPEFARFEEIIPQQLRGRLVIEFNRLDVFSDMGAFLFARDYLRERGFRLCLDGLTHLTLPYYHREQLGFDLIKVLWVQESLGHMQPEAIPGIRALVMAAGQARTILCHCENAHAIEVGQQLGIVMFQGRQVDRLLSQRSSGQSSSFR